MAKWQFSNNNNLPTSPPAHTSSLSFALTHVIPTRISNGSSPTSPVRSGSAPEVMLFSAPDIRDLLDRPYFKNDTGISRCLC